MNEYRAELIRVIDGDTVILDVHLGFHLVYRARIRLEGIDTPERGQNGYNSAKQALKERLTGELVVETSEQDSFGRWLGVVYCNGINVNESMLRDKFAKLYK